MSKKELLVGCGNKRDKLIATPNGDKWNDLTTLDISSACNPDIVWDLKDMPYPFEDNTFDEIHAYEVLEHTFPQGDYINFFKEFSEYYRILKPGGYLCITCPKYDGLWAWGDPGHTRIISEGSIIFLNQLEYEKQVGVTAMTDYREIYKADFDISAVHKTQENILIGLQAVKPSRIKNSDS